MSHCPCDMLFKNKYNNNNNNFKININSRQYLIISKWQLLIKKKHVHEWMIDRLNEWMNEWEPQWTCIQHIKLYPVGGDMSFVFFNYTQTTEEEQQEDRTEEQQEDRRATEEQFAVCLWVKWMCCDWRWLWMKWLELSWSLRRSNLRSVLLSYASSLGSQSFSCIFWNSLAKGIFVICPLAISHLVKNKRVYTVLLHSFQHRLL